MRLTHYLTENSDREDIIRRIQQDCQPFLKQFKGKKVEFYRGVKDHNYSTIFKRAHLEDRKPRDLSVDEHDALNKAFIDKFGWPARNGVFTHRSPDKVTEYGEPNIFIPIGLFEYVWSPTVDDLVEHQGRIITKRVHELYDIWREHTLKNVNQRNWFDNGVTRSIEELIDLYPLLGYKYKIINNELVFPTMTFKLYEPVKTFEEWLKWLKYLTPKEVVDKYQDNGVPTVGREVSFKCTEYYLIQEAYWDDVMNLW